MPDWKHSVQLHYHDLEIEDEEEVPIEPITAPEAPETAEIEVVDKVTETKVEAVIEPADEPQKVAAEIADVKPKVEQSEEPKPRRVGRRSTKRNYMQKIIESENEGEYEDDELIAAGYADNADLEEISEDEADSMERMRATILELMRKGEAFDEDDFGDDEDDRSL